MKKESRVAGLHGLCLVTKHALEHIQPLSNNRPVVAAEHRLHDFKGSLRIALVFPKNRARQCCADPLPRLLQHHLESRGLLDIGKGMSAIRPDKTPVAVGRSALLAKSESSRVRPKIISEARGVVVQMVVVKDDHRGDHLQRVVARVIFKLERSGRHVGEGRL